MLNSLNDDLLGILACPFDHTSLVIQQENLVCASSHCFAIEDGIPMLARRVRRELIPRNMEPCTHVDEGKGIDPFVDDWIVNTNGNLYWNIRGRLPRYPIPRWPLGSGDGKLLVDLGCSWGRWTISAARAGFRPIGMDVHLDALSAAARVSQQLGIGADFVCGDGEQLPFVSGSIDVVFSYSVLQHLDRAIVGRIFREISRVLKPGGTCLVQLPNASGLYNLMKQAGRGFREANPESFEMRYWTRTEIRKAVEGAGLQRLAIRADGFFSQNPQLSDLDLLSAAGKAIVLLSHAGCKAADAIPVMTRLADSLWIEAQTSSQSG